MLEVCSALACRVTVRGVIYRGIIYALWALQTTYIALTAIGVKRDVGRPSRRRT